MAEIIGLKELTRDLNKLAREVKASVKESVYVGYTASYAVYVHEAMGVNFKRGKQAKYLETPARTQGKIIFNAIALRARADTKSPKRFQRALVAGGLMLQRLSMQIVPIDTGALRISAFTAIESGLRGAMAASFARSNDRRNQESRRRRT